MTNCIKTGAYLRFTEYGAFAPADLYQVGDCVVARFVGLGHKSHLTVTHNVTIGQAGFYREDLGVLVVPSDQCVAVRSPAQPEPADASY